MNNLISLASNVTIRAWIGLENERVWMWHWSRPHQDLDYFNWRAEEPQNNSRDGCAVLDGRGEWFDSDCTARRSFICQGKGGTGAYTFVAEAKSWRDAQIHCRDLASDLVSIHSAEENQAVLRASALQSVWIGLFKDPWKWSDGSLSSFRHWKPFQPNYLQDQDCVAAVFRDQGEWN
ncbi:unnamed protein product [Tetraodon nigroviridis]|uniref:(spotted green pufferfish) hypothetical protein n=1 Tax=Tetraodon nigroviridis TaxID=99883 RepID=Q4RHV6_TETNG|nr:unnamed protein product [Tetraodon nigroviridis]